MPTSATSTCRHLNKINSLSVCHVALKTVASISRVSMHEKNMQSPHITSNCQHIMYQTIFLYTKYKLSINSIHSETKFHTVFVCIKYVCFQIKQLGMASFDTIHLKCIILTLYSHHHGTMMQQSRFYVTH